MPVFCGNTAGEAVSSHAPPDPCARSLASHSARHLAEAAGRRVTATPRVIGRCCRERVGGRRSLHKGRHSPGVKEVRRLIHQLQSLNDHLVAIRGHGGARAGRRAPE